MPSMHLGRAVLVSTTSGLEAELSSLLQFTPSINGAPGEGRLTDLQNDKAEIAPWRYRGNNFRVVLSLCLGDSLHAEAKDELVKNLADSLHNAEAGPIRSTPR